MCKPLFPLSYFGETSLPILFGIAAIIGGFGCLPESSAVSLFSPDLKNLLPVPEVTTFEVRKHLKFIIAARFALIPGCRLAAISETIHRDAPLPNRIGYCPRQFICADCSEIPLACYPAARERGAFRAVARIRSPGRAQRPICFFHSCPL